MDWENELILTTDGLYFLMVRFVDYTTFLPGFNRCSYSKSDTLVKYSEARFSPVSSDPADCIRLSRLSYYNGLEADENSGGIADDREGIFIESLNSVEQGSFMMETLKENFAKSFGRNKVSVKLTFELDDDWIYSTSIDPKTNAKRRHQMSSLSSDYDFMAGIEDPSKFAVQLGRDIIHQIALDKDPQINSNDRRIFVTHGPVIYWDGNLPKSVHDEVRMEHITLFVKRKRFEDQQEYRFLCNYPQKLDSRLRWPFDWSIVHHLCDNMGQKRPNKKGVFYHVWQKTVR